MHIKDMKLRTKLAVGSTAVAASMLAGGAAFAYFAGGSSSGSGSGMAGTASAPTLSNLLTTAALNTGSVSYDGSASTIDTTVSNTNPYSLGWGHDTVTIASVTPAPNKSCIQDGTHNSFVLTGSGTAASGTVGPGTLATPVTSTIFSGFSVAFQDLGAAYDQSGCIGATINFNDSVG